ncbi:chemotaxis protein CheB [Nodosilinea sp. E11]|uniref:chemotaxis protein CheB n=1 Tax=Nodosilinea sp. E11 TaxID=3037479 RepID=UPI002934278D|nr:chemotaxis protein CheB [Nodosilinea sp. E11]WOD41802.1 chemotaxis protein CheB [Nodosilinea sp. E11]
MAYELVAIGTSLGGLSALKTLLRSLPRDFSAALAIVQHRHRESDQALSAFLQQFTVLPVHEVEDKQRIQPGHVYFAPPDYHLLVECGYFSLSVDEPVSYARPSIDVLLESAADAYGERVIGVVLTGANQDGVQGLSTLKARGGMTIVQDPHTAESAVLPGAAIAAVEVDIVLPISQIAPHLIYLCQATES